MFINIHINDNRFFSFVRLVCNRSSSVSEHTNNKATPKAVNRLGRAVPKSEAPANTLSPRKNPRISADRSTQSPLNPKPTPFDRRSPKLNTPPDKQQTRVPKGPDLQAQLSLVQEDLKNATEKLVLIEQEKAQTLEILKNAQKSAEEANEKFREAHAAQKQAEEISEIEKFRAVEMEQAAIESTQKKEEEWKREIEAVKTQHNLDIAALLTAKNEVENVKKELAMNLEANDDENKINAQKIESLSDEVARLKALLYSKHENEADETTRLFSEIKDLKKELEKAKGFEQKLVEKEAFIENLNFEVETAKLAKKSACESTEEWRQKAEDLEDEASERTKLVSELDMEIQTLKEEMEKAKNYKEKMVEKEARLEELNFELEAAKLAEKSACKSIEDLEKKVEDLEARDNESTQLVSELDLEIQTLKQELEKAKSYKQKFVEKEAFIEKLNFEAEASKLAELSAYKSMEELQKKVKDLEARAEESNRLEKSASESLESVMKQLEGSNDILHDAESEIISLKEKVGLLEISIARQRGDFEETERKLAVANEKAEEMAKKAEKLEDELENMEEEKNQALNHEKLAAESVQTLLEEKNKIINELENLKDEERKNKKLIESLTTDLQEVSTLAKEVRERFSSTQTEQENYENQIENLRLVLNATNEKYQTMLDEAKHEIDILIDTIDQNKEEYQKSRTEWEQKEADMMKKVKESEEESSLLEREISKLTKLLKEAEEEAGVTKDEGLKESESEVVYLKEIIGETKAESMKLKENLLEKENELRSIIEENEEVRRREGDLIEKIEELKKLLDEAMRKKEDVVNEISENEKECDLPAKVVECYEQNHKLENGDLPDEDANLNIEILNGNEKKNENNEKEEETKELDAKKEYENNEKQEETKEVDVKMWEIMKIPEKESSQVNEQEKVCLEEEINLNVDSGEIFDHVNGLSSMEMVENGGNSPSKQYQKKKKPLLQKFGSLLKKKGPTNQK